MSGCGCRIITERIPRSNGGLREVWEPCLAHAAEHKLQHDQWLEDYRRGERERAAAKALREEFT